MLENNLNSSYVCDFAIEYEGKIVLGRNCVKSVQSYIESLVIELNIQNPEDLPGCDFVCEQLGDHQVNYDEFSSISLDTLENLCIWSEKCEFNVTVDYDYEKRVWRRKDDTMIEDLLWSTSAFPRYKDIMTLHLRPYYNPTYWVESSPRKERKVREESNVHLYQLNDNRTGFFFCVEDAITDQTMKLGTYAQARNNCTKILTTQVCEDPIITDRLHNWAMERINTTGRDSTQSVRYLV